MTQGRGGATIRFDGTLSAIRTSTLLRLPETASELQTVLEPDGELGHWMKVDHTVQQAAGIGAGDNATLEMVVNKDRPGAERAAGSCDRSGISPAADPGAEERDHPDGALGIGALGHRHKEG